MALSALTALTALIALAMPVSAATSISLDSRASWSGNGTRINVSGTTVCEGTGQRGVVRVTVTQTHQITGVQVTGKSNPVLVVCDGQPRSFGATVVGGPFAVGTATATAELTAPDGTTATTTRDINISI